MHLYIRQFNLFIVSMVSYLLDFNTIANDSPYPGIIKGTFFIFQHSLSEQI
uniref:Uncharacterized protein n=1 Tax=Anguilla anguilla TaxID=7936 RepID=A0A0E9W4Z3_ANGAN